MLRTYIGALIGMAVGMLLVGAWGADYGYHHGLASAQAPPGWRAAWLTGMLAMMYLFWLALPAGALVGGLAGFGSWLVRPRAVAIPVRPR